MVSIPGSRKGFFSFLYNQYRGLYAWRLSDKSVKLTIYLHLEPKLRMMELHLHSTTRFQGVMLN
jgi:hypothetical protein